MNRLYFLLFLSVTLISCRERKMGEKIPISAQEMNLGMVSPEQKVPFIITLHNANHQKVVIENIEIFCSCTVMDKVNLVLPVQGD